MFSVGSQLRTDFNTFQGWIAEKTPRGTLVYPNFPISKVYWLVIKTIIRLKINKYFTISCFRTPQSDFFFFRTINFFELF